jgi:hypothetical protein
MEVVDEGGHGGLAGEAGVWAFPVVVVAEAV